MNNTLLNPALRQEPGVTLVNTQLSADAALVPGCVVNGRYQILRQVKSAGEADIFLCMDLDQEERILKMYRRAGAVKEEVYQAISGLSSPAVARIYEVGTWGGRDYEVTEYFAGRSLEGRKFTPEELRESLIPQRVDGLHTLHQCQLLHRDLKPGNIMLRCADTLDVALIDFGIGSMLEEGDTVLVEQAGFTPEYAAPETFRGLYLEVSDYFSLGLTICALLQGKSPYEGLDEEQVARMAALQRVPLPEDVPPDLADLITGLTYPNLTNRKDEGNSDKRWGYEEVLRWLHHEKVPVPGRQIGFLTDVQFHGMCFSNLTDLTTALIEHWKDGKAALSSGALAVSFRQSLPGIAPLCAKAQANAKNARRVDIA